MCILSSLFSLLDFMANLLEWVTNILLLNCSYYKTLRLKFKIAITKFVNRMDYSMQSFKLEI